MIASARSATATPATTSSQKWLPVAITLNQTQAGQSAQSDLRQLVAAEEREGDADDQRVGGVQARHRGIGIRGELDEAAAVVQGRRSSRACR